MQSEASNKDLQADDQDLQADNKGLQADSKDLQADNKDLLEAEAAEKAVTNANHIACIRMPFELLTLHENPILKSVSSRTCHIQRCVQCMGLPPQ